MKKLFLIPLLLCWFQLANAQEKSTGTRNLTIKFPLSSLFGDIYAESMGIGAGIEKMIKPGLSFSQEVGYIFHVNTTSSLAEDLEKINGFKFNSEIRKYLNRKEDPESGFFINLEMKNIITRSTQQSWTVEDAIIENKITRYRGLLLANTGVLFYWDQYKKSKITLEILGGGGIGYLNAKSDSDTEALGIKTHYNSGSRFYPWVNVDIKIGYILR